MLLKTVSSTFLCRIRLSAPPQDGSLPLKWSSKPEVGETKTVYPRIAWLLIVVNLSVPAFVLFQRNGNNLSDAANIHLFTRASSGQVTENEFQAVHLHADGGRSRCIGSDADIKIRPNIAS